MSKFAYCPNCNSGDLEQTDYEDEYCDEDTDGRRCCQCGWEGDVCELVCIDAEEEDGK